MHFLSSCSQHMLGAFINNGKCWHIAKKHSIKTKNMSHLVGPSIGVDGRCVRLHLDSVQVLEESKCKISSFKKVAFCYQGRYQSNSSKRSEAR